MKFDAVRINLPDYLFVHSVDGTRVGIWGGVCVADMRKNPGPGEAPLETPSEVTITHRDGDDATLVIVPSQQEDATMTLEFERGDFSENGVVWWKKQVGTMGRLVIRSVI